MEERALYLEADEDITSAIDKLRQAPPGPVQIVVPKRSTLLQSVINLKLLKKAAEDSKRELVLVTGDKVASSLAARVGLAVAASVGAKAVVGESAEPEAAPAAEEVIEDDSPPPPEPTQEEEPESELASEEPKPTKSAKGPSRQIPPVLRQRQLADEPVAPAAAASAGGGGDKPKSKFKVPNYHSFQKRLIWVGLAVVLIIAYFVVMYFATSAKVTLFVSASPTDVATDFGVDTSNGSSTDATLAGQTLSATKTLTSTFQASGQQDQGTKASGTITATNHCFNPGTIASGTTFTAGGLNFTSTQDVAVPDAGTHNGNCSATTAAIPVTATANGDNYNLAPTSYSAAGYSSSTTSVTFAGGQMSGGTSKIVTVVAQSDVATAETAALSGDKAAELKALQAKLPKGDMLLADSFNQAGGTATSSPDVGQPAGSATLTLSVTFTALAVSKSDAEGFLKIAEAKQLGTANQIYEDGFGGAQFSSDGKTASGLPQFKVTTTTYAGQKIDTDKLATQLRGKRYGDAVDQASNEPGVARAEIALWPVWASSLPHITGHITIKISVASAK